MNRALLLTTAMCSLAFVGVAGAADIPRRPAEVPHTAPVMTPPMFDWSGFYVGLQGGYGWGSSRWTGPATGSFGTSGWLAGGTLGLNYQIGQSVIGLEGDFAWTDMGGTGCAPGLCQTRNKWLSTVRGRLGYAAGNFMPYLTGGVAFGSVEAGVPGLGSEKTTRTGWTVGAGVEHALAHNWSVKAEYLYVDLGSFGCGVACGGPPSTNVKFDAHIVRAGVNVRF